ncbi:MFS transporter [Candidatus Gracilibacteria bacterium]|nr:MFS transporter [Candidatus Gracilibacteria bacterium]
MQQQIFISPESGLHGMRKWNLHLTVGFLSFLVMLFHFTAVYFFTLQLESVALVGIFLGIGNLFAMLLDVPAGILQRYYNPRTLYISGAVAHIIAILIFANFIFAVTNFLGQSVDDNGLGSVIRFFLLDGLNMILLLLAAFCYGYAKEIYDVTTISYILNKATPDQYGIIISKNNLFTGVGAFFGLTVAGVILTFEPRLVVFFVAFILVVIAYVMLYYFDNNEKTLNLKEIERFKVVLSKDKIFSVGEELKYSMTLPELKKYLKNSSYIFLKPMKRKEKGSNVSMKEILIETKDSFLSIFQTLGYAKKLYLIVLWSLGVVLTFGFWDIFVATFLIEFLDQVKPGWSFILLGAIAIPAFGLQGYFAELAVKKGIFTYSIIGLFLSASSLIGLGFLGAGGNFYIVMGLALINSTGYAICMSIAVATFLEAYNIAYAKSRNLKEIDANASAAPMKILQNLGNVIGLFSGGFILSVFGYQGFFFVFGGFIFVFAVWSYKQKQFLQSVKNES